MKAILLPLWCLVDYEIKLYYVVNVAGYYQKNFEKRNSQPSGKQNRKYVSTFIENNHELNTGSGNQKRACSILFTLRALFITFPFRG